MTELTRHFHYTNLHNYTSHLVRCIVYRYVQGTCPCTASTYGYIKLTLSFVLYVQESELHVHYNTNLGNIIAFSCTYQGYESC